MRPVTPAPKGSGDFYHNPSRVSSILKSEKLSLNHKVWYSLSESPELALSTFDL